MKTAFVTGGSGFLGRNLIVALVKDGVAVKALGRSDKACEAVEALGAQPVRGDLLDVAALRAGAQGVDVIYHCAASVDDWGDRRTVWRINVEGTERVIGAAKRAKTKLVHVSTEAVLVDGDPIEKADEGRPYPDHPLGLYPETKGAAEQRVLDAAREGLDACIVRPRLIWGAGDTSVLPKLLHAVRGGKFAWLGGGTALTSSCHVDNVVEGMRCAAEKGEPGGIYFLTDGEDRTFRELLGPMMATQGVEVPDRSLPLWLARPLARFLETLWRVFSLSGSPPMTRTAICLLGQEVTVVDQRARSELGYEGKITVEAGLAAMRTA